MPSLPVDALAHFLAAVRAPLEFVVRAPRSRTRFPAAQLAGQGRVAAQAMGGARAELIEKLCAEVERFDSVEPAKRVEHARRCLAMIEEIGRPEPPPPAVYRASEGDVTEALKLLVRSVQFAHGVGPRRAEMLRKFGITTIYDLLFHLPFRYEDRRTMRTIRELEPGTEVGVVGEITHVNERVVGRKQRSILEGTLRDATGLLGLTWYHHAAHYQNRIPLGRRLLVFGKVEVGPNGQRRMVHPEVSLSFEAGQGILPVYAKPTGMSTTAMRTIVRTAIDETAKLVPSRIPPTVAASANVSAPGDALAAVHRPAATADVEQLNAYASPAHRSLVFDELFFLQLGLLLRRRAQAAEAGTRLQTGGRLYGELERRLPFSLTAAQRRVGGEIAADLTSGRAMHRLVHGDVGSGKTVVALQAALAAVDAGLQAAFMAPTELLAEQHFATIEKLARGLGVRTLLLSGSASRAERQRARDAIANGRVDLVVGTHAIIQEGVTFARLGLGVIDEQHRFGVMQRAALKALGAGGLAPHILLMSATPIPRTLALTLYGDLDVSLLDEMPPGRRPVSTELIDDGRRGHVYDRVKHEVARGRQAYVVFPLVEASEVQDLRDATSMARELTRTIFAGLRVGLLHGRMKADEKDAVMRRFRAGDLQVLVSTTVIEVGVDVPNATVMVVEHAERFGLSQMHQLRGRVGRGSEASVCFLVARCARGDDAHRRLTAMVRTTDGFKLAETDLRLRGPGEFLGTRQSGLPDFHVANLLRDSRLLVDARRAAEQWLEHDPALSSEESKGIREILAHRWASRLELLTIG